MFGLEDYIVFEVVQEANRLGLMGKEIINLSSWNDRGEIKFMFTTKEDIEFIKGISLVNLLKGDTE